MADELEALFERLRYGWDDKGVPTQTGAAVIAALTPADETDVIAALGHEADAYPVAGYPGAPLGSRFNAGYRFHALADIVGRRRAHAGIPVLRTILAEHGAEDARLAAARSLVAIGEPTSCAIVADLAVSSDDRRWQTLWIELQLATLDPAAAYVAIADRVASTNEPAPILECALPAARSAGLLDPRWSELAAMKLERAGGYDYYAIEVLVRLGDRRAVPPLLKQCENPGYGAVCMALEALEKLVGAEVVELVKPLYPRASRPDAFEEMFARQGPAGAAVLAERQAARDAEIAKQSHPFLFFGAEPGDWVEGANYGHLYIIGFAGLVADTRRREVQSRLAQRLQIDGSRWRWANLDGNSWVQLYCGGTPFRSMLDMARELHAAIPIREVIFGGLREESRDDDWTAWSKAQGSAAARVPILDPKTAYDMVSYVRGRTLVPADKPKTAKPKTAKPKTKPKTAKPKTKPKTARPTIAKSKTSKPKTRPKTAKPKKRS